ncbi:MAG TPA: FAD-binding oxidoreductase, partial [Tepidiformaceae bacterium]|nr:FAD-binding oxidoreductase [Tepidiformaceae bacterium]
MSEIMAGPLPLIAGRAPDTVYVPESLTELRDIVIDSSSVGGTTLVPTGGRTQLELGYAPTAQFSLLDLSQALRTTAGGKGAGQAAAQASGQAAGPMVEHQRDDLTAVVAAGTTLEELAAILAEGHQWLPIDPPLAESCTLGGALAVGVAGPLRARYGLPKDFVVGMTVLRADGTFVRAGGRVVKNVTGYDMMRLWCGSLGTLGVITEVALKVLPIPGERHTIVTPHATYEEAFGFASSPLLAGLRPEFCVSVRQTKGWETLTGVSNFDSLDGVGQRALLDGGRDAGTDGEGLYRAARDVGFASTDTLTVRVATLPSALGSALEVLIKLGPSGCATVPMAGFARATWESGAQPAAELLAPVIDQLRGAVRPCGGSVILERIPPELRARLDPWGTPPSAFPLMQRTKL